MPVIMRTMESYRHFFMALAAAVSVIIAAEFCARSFYRPQVKRNQMGTALFTPVALRFAARDDGPIFFIGDSTVRGLNVPSAWTTPFSLDRLIRARAGTELEVYNLARRGAAPPSELVTLRKIMERRSHYDNPFLIVQLHIRWLAVDSLLKEGFVNPYRSELYRAPGVALDDIFWPDASVLDLPDIWIARSLARVSVFYDLRQALSVEIPFGMTGKRIDPALPPPAKKESRRQNRDQIVRKADLHYSAMFISDANPMYRDLVEMLDLLAYEWDKDEVFIYISPLNMEALVEYAPQHLDRIDFTVGHLKELLDERGLPYIDLSRDPDYSVEDFFDDDHMNYFGNKKTAEKLFEALRARGPISEGSRER